MTAETTLRLHREYLATPPPGGPVMDEVLADLIDSHTGELRGRQYGPELGRCLHCGLVCDPEERECPRCGEVAVHVGPVTWEDQHAYGRHVRRQETGL